jgi:hypothetical protein
VRRGNRSPRPSPGGERPRDRAEEAVLRARATAYKQIPARGTTVHGETVVGLEPTVLKHRGLTSEEQADKSTTTRVLDDAAVTTGKIADEAVGSTKISAGLMNPGQATPGLRSISDTLGGSSLRAAAGDHSHGSGNSMDFDYLPEAQRRRALRVRQYLRARKGEMFARSGTAGERLVAVENRCEALTFMVLALARCLIDAPDLTAEQRQAARDAGGPALDFFEYRMYEARGDESFHDRTLPGYANEHPDMGEWVSPVA